MCLEIKEKTSCIKDRTLTNQKLTEESHQLGSLEDQADFNSANRHFK